jgi:hypothetical protein
MMEKVRGFDVCRFSRQMPCDLCKKPLIEFAEEENTDVTVACRCGPYAIKNIDGDLVLFFKWSFSEQYNAMLHEVETRLGINKQ